MEINLLSVVEQTFKGKSVKEKIEYYDSLYSELEDCLIKINKRRELLEVENRPVEHLYKSKGEEIKVDNIDDILSEEAFKRKEQEIEERIRQKAVEIAGVKVYDEKAYNDLDPKPIFDGVCDYNQYDKNGRIMWILKEPYDEIDEKGKLHGGDWHIYDGIVERGENCDITGSQKNMIYVTQGIIESVGKKEPVLSENLYYYNKYKVNILKSIAFINISKMPAGTSSGNMSKKCNNWKDILLDQLKLYNPKIIICGNTLDYIWNDDEGLCGYFGSFKKKLDMKDYDNQVNIYKKGDVILADAYHPGRKGQVYIDALIRAVHTAMKIK